MTISANFTVQGVANPAAHIVAYGATVNLALVSADGVDSVTFSIVGVSKADLAFPTITEGGSPLGATASFAMPATAGDGLGRSFRVKCVVRNAHERVTSYGVVGAANDSGILPVAAGEELDRGAFGWIEELNAALGTVSLTSPDGTFGLKQLSTENQQLSATLADSADHTLSIVLPYDSRRYYVTWFLVLDGLSYRYLVEYDRDGAGLITIVEETSIGGSLPSGVTVAADVGTGGDADKGQVVVSNASGGAIRSLGNATAAYQSI